ncbi:maleylpyruvate isomerase family mycothiol-dependent enzyme [Streptomyces albiflaviniger]|nr:maleylpyruvate isomerase family mycothiol-dependent enzyme [Streptomyces albiflaviniger]
MSRRAWMDHGTKLFLAAADGLADEAFDVPTALPGWTRKHLVAHVHFNAEALRRLVSWARTGEENRMYAEPEQRAAEIERGSQWSAQQLRHTVHESADALGAELDALSQEEWQHEVITAQGRTVPATEIPWMRAREVAVHTVDLKTGVDFDDLPDGFNAALIADVAAKRSATSEATGLARWLTGRTSQAPVLGPWL